MVLFCFVFVFTGRLTNYAADSERTRNADSDVFENFSIIIIYINVLLTQHIFSAKNWKKKVSSKIWRHFYNNVSKSLKWILKHKKINSIFEHTQSTLPIFWTRMESLKQSFIWKRFQIYHNTFSQKLKYLKCHFLNQGIQTELETVAFLFRMSICMPSFLSHCCFVLFRIATFSHDNLHFAFSRFQTAAISMMLFSHVSLKSSLIAHSTTC